LIPTLTTILQPLIGLPCWQVQWDANTNLAMNFGDPTLAIREPKQTLVESPHVREMFSYRHITVRGAWFLWVLHAYWKLVLRDGTGITGTSGQRQKQQALARLDGQQLLGATITPTTGHTILRFDLGAHLTLRRQQKAAEELWTLYTPTAHVLTVRGDGQMSYQSDMEPDSWRPIEQLTAIEA
jgi:hypothetical protein